MSGENKNEVDEVEIRIDWVDTPRGKVPTYDSISKAIEDIAEVLMEQDIRLESLEKKTTQQSLKPESLENILSAIESLRAEIKNIYEKLNYLEEILNEISDKTDTIDYLSELVERYFKTKREQDEV
ncbi:MAG: hypothetical protein QXV24_03845 [Nitrososphaerota archaeon]